MSDYPEHDKMAPIADTSQAIGEFLDWLVTEKDLAIVAWDGWRYTSAGQSTEQLLAEFFEIDLKKIEEEKRAMLDKMRAMNGA